MSRYIEHMHAVEILLIINNALLFVFAVRMQLANVGKILRVRFTFDAVFVLLIIRTIKWLRTFPNAFSNLFSGDSFVVNGFISRRGVEEGERYGTNQKDYKVRSTCFFVCVCAFASFKHLKPSFHPSLDLSRICSDLKLKSNI